MKNKLLAIAIASALSTLWSGHLLAEDPATPPPPTPVKNIMDIEQKNSVGTVEAEQDGTTGSKIKILQEEVLAPADGPTTTKVTVTQTGTKNTNATVEQYNGVDSTITIKQSGTAEDTSANIVNVRQGSSTSTTIGDNTTTTYGENAGNTLTIDTQSGSGNRIVGYSEADETTGLPSNQDDSFSTQTGTGNSASLNQTGSNNKMGFNQNGSSNAATLSQAGASSNNTMNVSQDGLGNVVTATQDGTTNSHTNINIVGDNNTLGGDDAVTWNEAEIADATYGVTQLSSDSFITVDITGNSNKASLKQTANASGSHLMLAQDGNDNIAIMTQNGANNDMDLTQKNNANAANLTQNGAGDSITLTQHGNSTVTLTQK
jgi:hypothetical protein